MSREVFCGDCGRPVADDVTEKGHEDRVPCEGCGSLVRRVAIEVAETARATDGVASVTISGAAKSSGLASANVVRLASAHGAARSSGSAAAEVVRPTRTGLGFLVRHRCIVQIAPVDDQGLIHAEVVRDGKVIADGVGDSTVDALLNLIEYMLPPDDPEYPTGHIEE